MMLWIAVDRWESLDGKLNGDPKLPAAGPNPGPEEEEEEANGICRQNHHLGAWKYMTREEWISLDLWKIIVVWT